MAISLPAFVMAETYNGRFGDATGFPVTTYRMTALCPFARRALSVVHSARGQCMAEDKEQQPESLLPCDEWVEASMRQVVARALAHVAANGLPGEHHFYLTFRTDYPGVVMPPRLRTQYPQEMTIVLQHQFWDLKMDEEAGLVSVGLSFGGVPASLVIPLGAVTGFADPFVRYGLQFQPVSVPTEEEQPEPEGEAAPEPEKSEETPQVVSLDAFRRRPPTKS